MKGDITFKILKAIKGGSLETIDLLTAFLLSGYGASYDMILRKSDEISSKRASKSDLKKIKSNLSKDDWRKINNRFNAVLSKLEKDGLIERSKNKKSIFVDITDKGCKKMDELEDRQKFYPKSYKVVKSDNPILFTFDIPEAHRKSRGWIRDVLKHLKFDMIQKSVWLGNSKIPEEFLDVLRKQGLIFFIEIIEITKKGTLKKSK